MFCLNWASDTKWESGAEDKVLVAEPKTIWFRAAADVNVDDSELIHNHKRGCYFTYWHEFRSAAFVFSPDPQLFQLTTTKPYVVGPPANARRTGLHMQDRHEWKDGRWVSSTDESDDRYRSFWTAEGSELREFLAPFADRYIDVERLIQFSTGRGLGSGWHEWHTLPSFRLQPDDTAARLRVCWSSAGAGRAYREACASDFKGFAAAVKDPQNFSSRLIAFKDQSHSVDYVSVPGHKRTRNLHITDGPSATALFLGFAPDRSRLAEVKLKVTKDLQEYGQDTQLLAIWYRNSLGVLCDYMDEFVPKITADPGERSVDIRNADR